MIETGNIISLLSAILTGGFLMLFIESQKLSASVIDRFQEIMKPFYHKLSNYMKVAYFFKYAIKIDNPDNDERIEGLKHNLDKFAKLCIDYDLTPGSYNAKELESICNKINNVWFLVNKRYIKNCISIDHHYLSMVKERIRPCLIEVSIKYQNVDYDLDFFAELSGDFYSDLYIPVQNITSGFEYWQNRERQYKILALGAIIITIINMLLIIFIPCLCQWFSITLTILSCILLITEIISLIFLEKLAQQICRV